MVDVRALVMVRVSFVHMNVGAVFTLSPGAIHMMTVCYFCWMFSPFQVGKSSSNPNRRCLLVVLGVSPCRFVGPAAIHMVAVC